MTPDKWYTLRNDRQHRYAGRVLSPDRPILIRLDPTYGARFDGQVAAIVFANLITRMSPRVAFDFPDQNIVAPLPWAQAKLRDFVLQTARASDPYGSFELRGQQSGDYVVHLGPEGSPENVHGSGWGAFGGPGASAIPRSDAPNPIGPALAVIVAAARLFGSNLASLAGPFAFDAYSWANAVPRADTPFPADRNLGSIWSIGAGSVGSAALYFLALATRRFSSVVFDMDIVKIENLDRSPTFTADDALNGVDKARSLEAYLRSVGVDAVESETNPLDLSDRWKRRSQNVPDVLISAANERNVRYLIEQSYPPLQIYATTGANWNVTAFRHIPFVDPCSCCAFPPGEPVAKMQCAKGKVTDHPTGEQVDAALPFLSFLSGLMTAAEIFKANLSGYPRSANRIAFSAWPDADPAFSSAPMRMRDGCICAGRSRNVHVQMIGQTKHAALSKL